MTYRLQKEQIPNNFGSLLYLPSVQIHNPFPAGWLQSVRVPFLSQPRTVDFDAFQRFVQSKDAAIEQAFRALDRDGNGEITRQASFCVLYLRAECRLVVAGAAYVDLVCILCSSDNEDGYDPVSQTR